MANEFTIQSNFRLLNGEDQFNTTMSYSADQVARGGGGPGVQEIGFSAHEAINLDGQTSIGFAVFKNLDPTNFVQIGIDVGATFYPVLKLLPGESQVFRFDKATIPYALADTANVRLQAAIFTE